MSLACGYFIIVKSDISVLRTSYRLSERSTQAFREELQDGSRGV